MNKENPNIQKLNQILENIDAQRKVGCIDLPAKDVSAEIRNEIKKRSKL